MKRIDGAGGAGGARRLGSDDSIQRNNKLPDGRNGWRWHSRCQTEGGRQDYVGSVAAKRRDRRDDYAEVALWDPQSRSLYANLAGVFGEEGMDAARRESAAAIAGRTELMARCYATLRVALQDIIEWKVGGRGGRGGVGGARMVLCESLGSLQSCGVFCHQGQQLPLMQRAKPKRHAGSECVMALGITLAGANPSLERRVRSTPLPPTCHRFYGTVRVQHAR